MAEKVTINKTPNPITQTTEKVTMKNSKFQILHVFCLQNTTTPTPGANIQTALSELVNLVGTVIKDGLPMNVTVKGAPWLDANKWTNLGNMVMQSFQTQNE